MIGCRNEEKNLFLFFVIFEKFMIWKKIRFLFFNKISFLFEMLGWEWEICNLSRYNDFSNWKRNLRINIFFLSLIIEGKCK